MKTALLNLRTPRNIAAVLLSSATLLTQSVSAQSTTWDGSGIWTSASSWSNGLPNATLDAVVAKTAAGDQTLNTELNATFKSLAVSNAISDRLTINFANGAVGGPATFTSSGAGKLTFRMNTGATATIQGALAFASSSTVSDAIYYLANPGTVLNVTGGFSLGSHANAAPAPLNVYLTHSNLGAAGSASINADVTLNNGSRFFPSAASDPTSVFNFNGSVTLQSGTFTGNAPTFVVGYASNADAGFKVKISNQLSAANQSQVTVYKGKTLEVDSASFVSGGTLLLSGFGNAIDGSTGTSVFRSAHDLSINGGGLNNTNTAGQTTGGYLLDIGGNFNLGTGSTISLLNNAHAITTMELAGNLNITATSLTAGNLNALRLILDGELPQTLEAAVIDLNDTFTLHTLTLDGGYVSLVNNHFSLGADEFFKTFNLVNIGTTTLNLNGLDFYVGNTKLVEGVYTDFGGTLTVVPEPSTVLFLLGGGALLAWRSRQRAGGLLGCRSSDKL